MKIHRAAQGRLELPGSPRWFHRLPHRNPGRRRSPNWPNGRWRPPQRYRCWRHSRCRGWPNRRNSTPPRRRGRQAGRVPQSVGFLDYSTPERQGTEGRPMLPSRWAVAAAGWARPVRHRRPPANKARPWPERRQHADAQGAAVQCRPAVFRVVLPPLNSGTA